MGKTKKSKGHRKPKASGVNPKVEAASTSSSATPMLATGEEVVVHQGHAISSLDPSDVAELVVDLWRLKKRMDTEGVSERLATSFERVEDRLSRLGLAWDSMEGMLYDTNLKVRVVDHEHDQGALTIHQCITPAVFFKERLVRQGEIITKGDAETK
ncbi:MAG: hypothetical protein ACK5ZK_00175 [Armatimonadota bacterium]|jgi:hydrogenase maturation factor